MSKLATALLALTITTTHGEPGWRQHQREVCTDPSLLEGVAGAVEQPTPEDELIRAELRHRVRLAVQALPDDERNAVLGLMDGETGEQTAERLGVSPRTIDRVRARAFERLRQALEDDE